MRRRAVYYVNEPAVSGDLFPYKVRVRVLPNGPDMLIAQHSTGGGARRECRRIAREGTKDAPGVPHRYLDATPSPATALTPA